MSHAVGDASRVSMEETTRSVWQDATESEHEYRELSKAAVLSFVLALLSPASVLVTVLLVLPAAGVVFGIVALRNIRRYPRDFSGALPAKIGLIGCAFFLLAGYPLNYLMVLMEVPEGYQLVSFSDLQPPYRSEKAIPDEALALDGKRVYIKGYIYPDVQGSNVKHFVLIPDLGTCCFGGQPKITDMVEVSLVDPLRVNFSMRRRGLGGVFKVSLDKKSEDRLGGVYYQLVADVVN